MTADQILAALAVLFAAIGGTRVANRRRLDPAGRTWLIVAAIFGGVSAWLWWG
jgi:hypothetical protein